MNKKILISLSVIGAVAAIAIGGTIAYFSDTETSTGNTFTAGELDLLVDNTCYYNKLADGNPNCPMIQDGNGGIVTTWRSTDLGAAHKFFYFDDIKPGDFGEDTISLTVDNDACLKLDITNLVDNDVTCTEPEGVEEGDTDCGITEGEPAGELQENVLFTMWLDQGVTPGFQGPQDLSECDNDYVEEFEPVIISEGAIDEGGETWNLADYAPFSYLPAGQKACFGVSWKVLAEVGNEIQSDSLVGDMIFNVIQRRHNESCRFPQPQPEIIRIDRTQVGFGDGGWAGWSCPADTTAIGGGIDSNINPVGYNGLAVPGQPNPALPSTSQCPGGVLYPCYPHYTFPAGETGYVVQDFPGDSLGNTISFHVDCQVD